MAGRVRRACDDAPLSVPVRLCDAPYLLGSSKVRENRTSRSVSTDCPFATACSVARARSGTGDLGSMMDHQRT